MDKRGVEWMPLPTNADLSLFVKKLLDKGVQSLASPPGLEERSFFATCRKIINPHVTPPVDRVQFQQLGKWASGFTEAYIIDLFEEIPPQSKNFIPFAHRDVRIVQFDDEVRASGNFSVSRRYAQYSTTTLPEDFAHAAADADKIWGRNGIDVLDSESNTEQEVDEEALSKLRNEKQIPARQSWRGLGFGKLLVGLELELLKQNGVQRLELPSVSDELQGILDGIKLSVGGSVDISGMDQSRYAKLTEPFVRKTS